MSDPLQQRAKKFLQRPVPKNLAYAPGSISEGVIAAYADRGPGALDDEMRELLELCTMETESAAEQETGEVREYLGESAGILRAILEEG